MSNISYLLTQNSDKAKGLSVMKSDQSKALGPLEFIQKTYPITNVFYLGGGLEPLDFIAPLMISPLF